MKNLVIAKQVDLKSSYKVKFLYNATNEEIAIIENQLERICKIIPVNLDFSLSWIEGRSLIKVDKNGNLIGKASSQITSLIHDIENCRALTFATKYDKNRKNYKLKHQLNYFNKVLYKYFEKFGKAKNLKQLKKYVDDFVWTLTYNGFNMDAVYSSGTLNPFN